MQIPLLNADMPAPLPVDDRVYVPALQNRSGELDALRHASARTWERITPLVHVVGPKPRPKPLRKPTVQAWVKKVASAVGDHAFYLDVLRLNPSAPVATPKGNVAVLQQIFAAARRRRLRFIPVIWVGESSNTHRALVADAALEDGQGVALRYRIRTVLPPAGTTPPRYLADHVEPLLRQGSDVDLLIDLRYIGPDDELHVADLAALVNELVDVAPWRGVAIFGTSMPSILSCIDEGSVGSLPRREWDLWLKLADCDLTRVPAFGDYAIQNPDPPSATGLGMRANIRYTANGLTLIARGHGPFHQEGKPQYRELCQQLVMRGEFCGSDYSWGDALIADCARGAISPGAQNVWRGAGTSHHLRLVTDQLRQLL